MLMVYARGLEWRFERPLGKVHREQARAKGPVLSRSLIGGVVLMWAPGAFRVVVGSSERGAFWVFGRNQRRLRRPRWNTDLNGLDGYTRI